MVGIKPEELEIIFKKALEEKTKALIDFWTRLHKKETKVILKQDVLGPGAITDIDKCELLFLQFIRYACITVSVRFDPAATAGARVHIRASTGDGIIDSEDYATFDITQIPGRVGQRTFPISPDLLALKVMVENLDTTNPLSNIKVTAVY